MFLLAHDTEESAKASAAQLQGLGGHARRLLEECVQEQSVTRTKVSKAATQLSDAGFVFIKESPDVWSTECTITPALAGEEALEMLEQIEEAAQEQRKACAKK
jgi:hypothetical protein